MTKEELFERIKKQQWLDSDEEPEGYINVKNADMLIDAADVLAVDGVDYEEILEIISWCFLAGKNEG